MSRFCFWSNLIILYVFGYVCTEYVRFVAIIGLVFGFDALFILYLYSLFISALHTQQGWQREPSAKTLRFSGSSGDGTQRRALFWD